MSALAAVDFEQTQHAAKAQNVENIAVVANVVVENLRFLSHLQRLVIVKVRWSAEDLPVVNPYTAACR